MMPLLWLIIAAAICFSAGLVTGVLLERLLPPDEDDHHEDRVVWLERAR